MGRGRVELKRIENKINRQVTFSKRRSPFSATPTLYNIQAWRGSLNGMRGIHTQRGSLLAIQNHMYHGSWTLEYAKLKARVEVLQTNQRHFMGEELDTLSLKELQRLEQQLDYALKHIRSKKNQLMFESISELQKKDKALQEQNNMLANKVKCAEQVLLQHSQYSPCTLEAGQASKGGTTVYKGKWKKLSLKTDPMRTCRLGC